MASPSAVKIAMIDALCPGCSTMQSLEACSHCMQPLCSACVDKHIDAWKIGSIKYCDNMSKKIEKYITKMSSLNPLIFQNKANIDIVKSQIEESFQAFVQKLNSQKDDLFNKIDQIENENQEFKKFENEILKLKENLTEFQEEVKKNDKELIPTHYKSFQQCKDQVQEIGSSYSILKTKVFKIIGEYEKPQTYDFNLNFFGDLIINESELLKSTVDLTQSFTKKEKTKNVKSSTKQQQQHQPKDDTNDKIQMFGTLRVKLRRLVEQMNELQTTIKMPLVEFDLTIKPKYITNNNKNVFIADEEGNLIIAELTDNLIVKSTHKLNISNIRGISANKKYLAVSFSNLSEEQISSIAKTIKKFDAKGGVLLYKIIDSGASLTLEKSYSSAKNYSLLSPSGIGINDSYLFVCDRDLHAVYKIELKNGNLVQRLITTDQEPTSISLGEKHFVYTDCLKLELNLVDMDKLTILKTVKFSEELFNEPFDLTFKENSFVFVKNRADTRVILYDSKLNIKYSFEFENSASLGISFVRLKNDYLMLGYASLLDTKNEFKLGLFTDF